MTMVREAGTSAAGGRAKGVSDLASNDVQPKEEAGPATIRRETA